MNAELREPCDRSQVVVIGSGIGLAIGFDAEDEPREWVLLSAPDARALARVLNEAAAEAGRCKGRSRKRGDP